MPARTLVVDFDGTITDRDLLDDVAQTFGDERVYREVDEGLDRQSLTLHDVLRREFEPVRAPLEDVVEWVLEHARVRPGFHELVDHARAEGWNLVIVSSGFKQLIEPVLRREGLEGVPLVSNEVEPGPDGWRVRFRDEDECGTCGEPCKRATVEGLADGGEVVLDGRGKGPDDGNFLGPTIIEADPSSEIAKEEIFGPVLTLVRARDLDHALEILNSSTKGNAASIFTTSGGTMRRFRYEAECGMLGVNIGVAAPMSFFPFTGWKDSFFGDLHAHGRDAIDFYTEKKVVITRWPKTV
jgi:HAD superfamily phosphoserine phosphatase-like hydrolase